MPHAINSFDVFDTLIARRGVEPRHVLDRLESQSGLPGLAEARLAADRLLGSRGQLYTLRDIWAEVGCALGLGERTTNRLLDLEVELEHEEVLPITENLAQVRDGDLLLSDTYLPPDVVRSLLRRVGFDRQVALVVSNDGKHRGWIWPRLLEAIRIQQHFGDNPHADGQTPSAAGIPAVIYTGSRRSPAEQFLTDQGWAVLANLVREVRLANPFTDAHQQQRQLWAATCQLNFPLLFFASLCLERYARGGGVRELLFVSRDCLQWQQLYRALFPHRRTTYLYTSRKCLLKPTESYLAYFRSTWHPDAAVVDLFSTGASWGRLFSRLGTRARCWFIGRVDTYSYLPGASRPEEWLDMTVLFRNSELSLPPNKNVEMLNYAPHGVVEDVLWLPGNVALPVLADELEYDPAFPQAAHRAFGACLEALRHYPDLKCRTAEGVEKLIRTLVEAICADTQLPTIYADHEAADSAYLRRILG
jgi:hypothetical protein